MAAPLVDYNRYRAYYSRALRFEPVTRVWVEGRGGRFRAPMGSFKLDLLEMAGHRVRALLHEYTGRKEKHRGVAKGRVYFKWELTPKDPDLRRRLLIASDEIRDMGYDVVVTDMGNKHTNYVKLTISW